jgi:hypothetical protein
VRASKHTSRQLKTPDEPVMPDNPTSETPEFKYLAIKNWSRYQSTRRNEPKPWIRDYVDQDFDADQADLTVLQRYMLICCRRLRGRFARNLNNSFTHIIRASNVRSMERPRCHDALQTLVERGFLIPTNQQVDLPVQSSTEHKQSSTLQITGDEDGAPQAKPLESEQPDSKSLIELCVSVSELLNKPTLDAATAKRWKRALKPKLEAHSAAYVLGLLKYALEENEVWARCFASMTKQDPVEYFALKFETIEGNREGDEKFKKIRGRKSGKDKNVVEIEEKRKPMEL